MRVERRAPITEAAVQDCIEERLLFLVAHLQMRPFWEMERHAVALLATMAALGCRPAFIIRVLDTSFPGRTAYEDARLHEETQRLMRCTMGDELVHATVQARFAGGRFRR